MKSTPFISASKLVEYCFASSPRRTAIIESMMAPPMYILDTGYPDIDRAAAEFIASKASMTLKRVAFIRPRILML